MPPARPLAITTSLASRLALAAAIAACAGAAGDGEVRPRGAPAWDADRASAYLQARAAKWFEARPCALSCHTTHPFVLVGDGSPIRERIVTAVRARVAAWPDVEPWYDSDDDKVAQSRGTESVLDAFALAGTDAAGAALDNMFAQQDADGGWRWLDFDLAPFESADARVFGAALAAIAVGRAGAADTYRDGRAALLGFVERAKQGALGLHDELALLWASRHLDGVLTAADVGAYVAGVRAVQRADGGFSLADLGAWRRRDGSANHADDADGYATAFAAFVLGQVESADAASVAASARCWLVAHQGANGAWVGRSMNRHARFNRDLMSDAATAFAVMALKGVDVSACGAR